jgi:hypothetical protein
MAIPALSRVYTAVVIVFLLPLANGEAQSSSAKTVDRWWLAAGIGGLRAPFDEHLVSLTGELGLAHQHVALLFDAAKGLKGSPGERGSSRRDAWAFMVGPSQSRPHFNAHLAAGAGRLSSCTARTEGEVCQLTKRFAPAFNLGLDVNIHDALGFQLRQAWLGSGSDSYRPLTFGIIIGRLAPNPAWDRR